MTNLRFKEYVFRNNPRKLVLKHQQEVMSVCCYGLGRTLQQLGKGLTIVEGEGELFGEDALEQFTALKKLMQQGGSGVLCGAGLEPMKTVFESLQMIGKGGDETISYSFRFTQDRGEA